MYWWSVSLDVKRELQEKVVASEVTYLAEITVMRQEGRH